jgi:hypothetical protein
MMAATHTLIRQRKTKALQFTTPNRHSYGADTPYRALTCDSVNRPAVVMVGAR